MCLGLTVQDLYSDKVLVGYKDRYYDAIVESALKWQANNPGRSFRFKHIYHMVCTRLGATIPQAMRGLAPDPYSGEIKDMRGLIRSWIEERSPHSRQHYFRGGRRMRAGWRPQLFVNWGLGEANTTGAWMPYRTVRGDGWTFNPAAAASWAGPTNDVLVAAEAQIQRKGMRGHPRTVSKADVAVYKRKFNFVKASVSLASAALLGGAICISAFTAPRAQKVSI